jgi:hypothetical protein
VCAGESYCGHIHHVGLQSMVPKAIYIYVYVPCAYSYLQHSVHWSTTPPFRVDTCFGGVSSAVKAAYVEGN